MQDTLIPKEQHTRFAVQDISRSSNVTRWHSVNCFRYPSIAEHSYLVTMYAREILHRINPNATEREVLLLLEYCLFHDLPEVLTGDMATPVKRRLEALFPDGESPLDMIEEALCPDYKDLKHKIKGSYLAVIAKIADVLEAVKFIDIEGKKQTGSHETNMAIIEIMKSFSECLQNSDSATPEHLEKFSSIEEKINKVMNKEQNDAIIKIRDERINNFKKRVSDAQIAFPEFEWSHALDVMDDLLNGEISQIDFIDK